MKGGLLSLLAAVLIGLGVATGVSLWEQENSAQREREVEEPDLGHVSDRVTNAIAGLADDGVYVAPDARDLIDERGERSLVKAVAEAEVPVSIVIWTKTFDAGTGGFMLGQQLEREVAEQMPRGVLFVWEGPNGTSSDTLIGDGFWINDADFLGDPAITLPEMIEDAEANVEWREPDPYGNGSDYYGGLWGGFAVGLIYGTGALLGIAALWGLARLAGVPRLRGSWRLSNVPSSGPTKDA